MGEEGGLVPVCRTAEDKQTEGGLTQLLPLTIIA